MSERKRGKLSNEETDFIRANAGQMDIESIAIQLNRTVDPVKRYMAENGLLDKNQTSDELDVIALKKKLRSRPYWNEVVRQLSPDSRELDYFEKIWIELMNQFDQDVTATEELQMKQWIMLEILMNRNMDERNRYVAELNKVETLLADEYAKDPDLRDLQSIAGWETRALQYRNAAGSHNNDHVKLLDKVQAIVKDLKGTRDMRFKRVEDGKSTWLNLIKMLEDEKIRRQEGEQMELMRLAGEEAKRKMSEYHTYIDGTVDVPFLNSETVKEDME